MRCPDWIVSRCESDLLWFFFSSRRRHTRCSRDWSSDVCSSDLAEFDDQGARGDEAGDLRTAEFGQQAEDLPVNRLFAEPRARIEVTADDGGLDAGVERGGIEGDEAALAVTHQTDVRALDFSARTLNLEGIHRRQDLLHFITDDMAAQTGGLGPPVNQNGYQDLAAILGQAPGELAFGREAGSQANDHFRGLAGVRDGHHAGDRLCFGLEPEALTEYALKHRPAHGLNRERFGFCDQWL